MKNEAIERIKATLTPKVTIESAYDTEEGIVAQIKQGYSYPERPILWGKLILVEADKDGTVLSTKGLF